ncbi:50S ribosomal protein L6 [Candidatus Peregrinibacteria bacterium]|nr:50S ribosomal protein L6 [Candidatus Peregrinibacteria bacterium]
MSRIGKKPIIIPAGVETTIQGQKITLKGPKGTLSYDCPLTIGVDKTENKIIIKRSGKERQDRCLHGLARALINNMATGVSRGFEKRLEIIGVGFRAQVSGQKVTLNLGFSHPIEYLLPQGIKVEMDKENKNVMIIQGADSQAVGEVAANIRGFRPPEPYKGKGIRYVGEYVPHKAGKAAAGATSGVKE